MINKSRKFKSKKIIPVILAGGSGSRLWPLSRASYPKQYLPIKSRDSLSFFQETVRRVSQNKNIDDPIIICNEEHRFIVAEQLRNIGINYKSILLEPVGRNTAPAITLASIKACEHENDPILFIMPSDHLIKDIEQFNMVLDAALRYCELGKIITFGIIPNKPETGYGYIEAEKMLDATILKGEKIIRFTEKPNKEDAIKFILDKKYTWNSGMFLFKASVLLKEIKINNLDIYELCRKSLSNRLLDLDFQRIEKEVFSLCPNISFDKAIMEKTNLGIVLPLEVGWSDIGSWQSMWEVADKDDLGNVIDGKVITENVRNSYLRSDDRLIVGIGLENLIVIESRDAILISNKNETQKVKNIVQFLIKEKDFTATSHRTIFRPWGNYTSIEKDSNWQVKKIIVKPNSSLSLQFHKHRTEHWIVVDGTALVEIDGKEEILNRNESTYIPLGSKHRLSNKSDKDLVLIEVQSGNYLGEDDIIRIQDNYGRI